MKPLVIIPALNEEQTIEKVIRAVLDQKIKLEILIVDGYSVDNTVPVVRELARKRSNIHLISQEARTGFGNALCSGFRWALERNYDPVITMDGDISHDPAYIKKFLVMCNDYDLVIGSRYVDGVRVEGWEFRKLLLSKIANSYIAALLIKPVWDYTSGFRCYRKAFLEKVDLNKLNSRAYIIQIQLLYLAYQNHFSVKEIPFIFRETHIGSKISSHASLPTFLYVLKYRAPLLEILRHITFARKDYPRYVDEYHELTHMPKFRKIRPGLSLSSGKMRISIGVMAYNEEKIISRCIMALLGQKLDRGIISEIIVVSSGSTDNTNNIVETIAAENPKVKLVVQEKRCGKASAINEFLAISRGDIVVVESADTVAKADCVEELILPFENPDVGMTGAHPVPINEKKGMVGYFIHKMWELHHCMALVSPKCGEMVAFRNVVPHIPRNTAVDEASIEGMFIANGYKLAYAARAIVYNKGPETISDFIRQRRRIASGHRHVRATIRHVVSTQKPSNIIRHVIATQNWNPRDKCYTVFLIGIEAYSRFMGAIDYYFRDKNPYIWDISHTTKHMK